jgi:hypothetical protein
LPYLIVLGWFAMKSFDAFVGGFLLALALGGGVMAAAWRLGLNVEQVFELLVLLRVCLG